MSETNSVDYYPDGSSYKYKGQLHAGWGIWKITKEGEKGFYGAAGADRHVDIGEVKALERSLADAVEQKHNLINIYQDATYAVNGFNDWVEGWAKKGWISGSGKPVANAELWKTILEHKQALAKAGASVNCVHVKGHDGIHGNEMADQCAKRGVIASYEGKGEEIRELTIEQMKTDKEGKEVELVKPTKAKKETKKPVQRKEPINEFICSKFLIEFLNVSAPKTEDGRNIYVMADWDIRSKTTSGDSEDDDNYREASEEDEMFEDQDEVMKRTQKLGIVSPDATYGLLVTNHALEQVDLLREVQNHHVNTRIDNPFIVDWTKVKKAAIWNDLHKYGEECLDPCGQSVIHKKTQEYLTYFLPAPRLAKDCVNQVIQHLDILKRYEAGTIPPEDMEDITEYFLNKNDKGKWSKKKTTEIPKCIEHPCRFNDQDIILRLTQKVDLPEASAILRMFSQEKQIAVKLIRYLKSKVGFRYVVLVEGIDNTLIYSASMSNIRLVP